MSTTPEYMPWEEQSLKTKLFTFHGRLSRRHYIYLTILTWVLAGAISYLLHTASATLGTMTGGICLIVAVILAIPTTIISLSIAVRRWHDLNKSWQYVLINVCCAFAGVFSLFLYAYLFIAKERREKISTARIRQNPGKARQSTFLLPYSDGWKKSG